MRVLVAVLVMGLLVGCGCFGSSDAEESAVNDASEVDMCSILTDEELSRLGLLLDTRREVDVSGVFGCQWVGESITLSLERIEDTVADYVARRDGAQFTNFKEKRVNDRAGAQFSVRRSGEQCMQLMDGGSVSLGVGVAASSSLGPPIDPCAEALRIAEMIEPRLP